MKADDRIPSETELVRKYKVSRITASKALNDLAELGWIYRIQGNGSFVSKDIDKILQSPELLYSYKVSQNTVISDNSFSKSNKEKIGLIIPTISDSYAQELVSGSDEEAKKRGYSLLIRLTNGSRGLEKEAIVELNHIGVQGMLIFPVDHSVYNEEILNMKINRFPFVLLDRKLPGIITNYVMSDNALGARSAVKYLYEIGHRRIAFCTDNNMHVPSVADRYIGFKDQAMMYNIPGDIVFKEIKLDYMDFSKNKELLKCIYSREVTAFFSAQSYVCMYMYAMLQSMGFTVPGDFSLISNGNPMATIAGLEFFTYINQNSSIIGQEAVNMLCDIVEGKKERKVYYNKIIPAEICVRKSTTQLQKSISFFRGQYDLQKADRL